MTRSIDPNAFPARTSAPREGGMALVATLMALSILTLVGLTATFVATTETLINHNLASGLVNRYLAESAVEEARSRLPAILPVAGHEAVYLRRDATIDPTAGTRDTNPFFDPAYGTHGMRSARFIDSDLAGVEFAWVRVARKTEERAGYELDGDSTNNGEVVGYGYDSSDPGLKAFQFVGSRAGHHGSPVYLLTGLATDPSGSRQMVRTEVARPPMLPFSARGLQQDRGAAAGWGRNHRKRRKRRERPGWNRHSGRSIRGHQRGSGSARHRLILVLDPQYRRPDSHVRTSAVDPHSKGGPGCHPFLGHLLGVQPAARPPRNRPPGADIRGRGPGSLGQFRRTGFPDRQRRLEGVGFLPLRGGHPCQRPLAIQGILRWVRAPGSAFGEPSFPIPKREELLQYSRERKSGSATTPGSWQPSISPSGMPGSPTGHSPGSNKCCFTSFR